MSIPASKPSSLVTALIVGAILALIGLNIWYASSRSSEEGSAAPDFTLPVLNAQQGAPAEVSLSDLRGKVVVMDFWAIHCGPCIKSFPHVDAFYRSADPDRVAVITINEGPTRAVGNKVQRFISQNRFTVPVLMDNGSVFRAYGISSIPHTVIIGPDGDIRRVHHGAMSRNTLEDAVQEILDDADDS